MRPIPSEQLLYARTDTHFLLAIYDQLRAELSQKKGDVEYVLDASAAICQQSYAKEAFDPFGWQSAVKRLVSDPLPSEVQGRLAKVWDWRDKVARLEDESLGFVLSTQLMLHLARNPPTNQEGLVAATSRSIHGPSGPPLVIKYANELLVVLNSDATGSSSSAIEVTSSGVDAGTNPFTFTPSTSSAAAELLTKPTRASLEGTTTTGAYRLASSPVAALETDELYRTTGWLTPLPIAEKSQRQDAPSKESPTGKIRKIKEELSGQPFRALIAKACFDHALEDEDPYKKGTLDVYDSSGDEEDENELAFEDIPGSMAEIFQISNRNRTRNKEKKKQREAQHPSTDDFTEVAPADTKVIFIFTDLPYRSQHFRLYPTFTCVPQCPLSLCVLFRVSLSISATRSTMVRYHPQKLLVFSSKWGGWGTQIAVLSPSATSQTLGPLKRQRIPISRATKFQVIQ